MKLPSLLVLGCGLALAALVPFTRAGEKKGGIPVPKTGPEHEVLASLAGTYDATAKAYFDPKGPTESTGTMKRQMILAGRFLQEDYEGKIADNAFQGRGMIGYDARKKKFVTAWADNMTTSIMITEGTYDATTKTLTSIGEDFEPVSGKKMKGRDVLKIIDADTQLFEMYRQPEGSDKEFKVLEVKYTRRK